MKNQKQFDSISVLRVFVKNWKIFVGIFVVIMLCGAVYIFYKSNQAKVNNQIIQNQYIFSLVSKKVNTDIFVPNRSITQAINVAKINILASNISYEDKEIFKQMTISSPVYNHITDVYWFLFEADDINKAKEIFCIFKDTLEHTNEILAYKARLESLYKFSSLDSHKYIESSAFQAGLQEALTNGILLWSEPSNVQNLFITDSAMGVRNIGERFSTRSLWILLCVSAFICASLGAFGLEFIRDNLAQITSQSSSPAPKSPKAQSKQRLESKATPSHDTQSKAYDA